MLSSRDRLPSSRKADGGHPPHSSREAMAVAINYLIWGAALLFGASSYSCLLFSRLFLEATDGRPLSPSLFLCSPVLLEKPSPSIERGNGVAIPCLREKQMVAIHSAVYGAMGMSIIVGDSRAAVGGHPRSSSSLL